MHSVVTFKQQLQSARSINTPVTDQYHVHMLSHDGRMMTSPIC